MARSTFLEIINSVKVLLRESEAASSTEDEYTALIAKFVTLAKEKVESSWDWSFQKRPILIFTTSSTFVVEGYDGTRLTNRGKIVSVFNTTDQMYLQPISADKRYVKAVANSDDGLPLYYTVDRTLDSTTGARQVHLYPPYTTDKTIVFWAYEPQTSITDGTYLEVDDQPLIWYAYALALKERGEDGGMSSGDAMALFMDSLNRAIELDSIYKDEDETTWVPK